MKFFKFLRSLKMPLRSGATIYWSFWYSLYQRRLLKRADFQPKSQISIYFSQFLFLSYWYSFYRLNNSLFSYSWNVTCQWLELVRYRWSFKFSNYLVKLWRFLFLQQPSSQKFKQFYLLNRLDNQSEFSLAAAYYHQEGWNSQPRTFRGFFLFSYVSWRWRTVYYPYLLIHYPRTVYRWTFRLRYRDYLTLPVTYLFRYSKWVTYFRYHSIFQTKFKLFQHRSLQLQTLFWEKKFARHQRRIFLFREKLKTSFEEFLFSYPHQIICFQDKKHRTHPENESRRLATLKLVNKVTKRLENKFSSRFRGWLVKPVYRLSLLNQPYSSLQDPITVGIDSVFPTSDLEPFDELYDQAFEDQQDDTEEMDADFNDETDLYGTGSLEENKFDRHFYRRFPKFTKKKWAKYGIPYHWRPYQRTEVVPLFLSRRDHYRPDDPPTIHLGDSFLEEEFFTFNELSRNSVFYDSDRLLTGDGPNIPENDNVNDDPEKKNPLDFNKTILDWHFMFRENNQLTNREVIGDFYSIRFWWYRQQFPRAFDDFPRAIFQFHRRFRRWWSVRFYKRKFEGRDQLYAQRRSWHTTLHVFKRTRFIKRIGSRFRRVGRRFRRLGRGLSKSELNLFYRRHQAHLAREGHNDQQRWLPRTRALGYDYYKKHFDRARPPKPATKWVRQLKSMGRDRSTKRRIYPRRHFPKYSPVYTANRLLFEQLTGNNTFGFRRFMFTRDDFYPAVGLFGVFFIAFFIWVYQVAIYFVDDGISWQTRLFDQRITNYFATELARRPIPSDLYKFFDPRVAETFFFREYPVRPRQKDIRWNVYGAHIGRMKLWHSWHSLGVQIEGAKFNREISWFYAVGKAWRNILELNPNWIFQIPKAKRRSFDFEPPWIGDWNNYRMPFRSLIDSDYFPQRKSTIHHRREIIRVHGKNQYRNTMWTGATAGQIYFNHCLPHASYISSRLIFGDFPIRTSTRWLADYSVLERNYLWPFSGAIRGRAVRNLNYLYTDTLLPVRLQRRSVHSHLFQATPLWENYLNSLFVGSLRQLVQSQIDQRSYYDLYFFQLFRSIFNNWFLFFYSFNWSLFYFWWFILFFPLICLTNFRHFYLARLQTSLLTSVLVEQPIKRGCSSSTNVNASLTAFDSFFYQQLWLRLENLYSNFYRHYDNKYGFYDIVKFKGGSLTHKVSRTNLSRTIPTVKHRRKPKRKYSFHNSSVMSQNIFSVNQVSSKLLAVKSIRASRLIYDQLLFSSSLKKLSPEIIRPITFERLVRKSNSVGWLARPISILEPLIPGYSLLRQPESNQTIVRLGSHHRQGRFRRHRLFDSERRRYYQEYRRRSHHMSDGNHHFRVNLEIKPFQLKRLPVYRLGIPPIWVLKRTQHVYLLDRYQQTLSNFNFCVSPAPFSSSLYNEFVEAIFVSNLDSGYDTELFEEDVSDFLYGNHGEEEGVEDGFDRGDNVYEDYSLISSLTGKAIARVVQPDNFIPRQLNLISYQRFNSLALQYYQFSPPTETKQIDGYFLSETYYSSHAVDHSGFAQLFLTTYSLPLLYQFFSVSRVQSKKLSPTIRSSEKDKFQLDFDLQLKKKNIPVIKQVPFLNHSFRQSKLFRTRAVELFGDSFNNDWPVRNSWLTNHFYQKQNYELWDDLASQIQDYTYEIGLTVVDYPDVDVVWSLDDEDTIDLETSVSYNLGYRWSGMQLYLESFFRPLDFERSVLDPVWSYESGYNLERELYPENLNYQVSIDLENYLLEFLTKDYTTSFDYENVFYDLNEYVESIETADKGVSDDDDGAEMDEDSEMNLLSSNNIPERLLRNALNSIVLGSSSMDHLLDRFNGLHSSSGFPFIYSRYHQSLYELHFPRRPATSSTKRSRYGQPGLGGNWRSYVYPPTEYYLHENFAHPLDTVSHHLMESLYCDFFISQWAIDEIYYKDSPHGICVQY